MVDCSDRGFTLLEVMVALAIVAFGMLAVQTQLNRYVVTAAITEEKTLASWVASNKLTELSVAQTWPEVSTSTEEVEFAQRQWELSIEVSETEIENLRRVDVRVFLADDPEREIHKSSGLIEPPPPPGYMPVRWIPSGMTGPRG